MTLVQLWAKLNPFGLAWAHYLLTLLWQSSLLLVGVGILTWCLRRRSASLRHTLWVGAILLIPVLPLLTSTATRFGSPQLPVRVQSLALPSAPTLSAPSASDEAQYLNIPPVVLLNDEATILQLAARPWTLVIVVYLLALLRLSGWMAVGLWQLWRWKRKATPSGRPVVQEVFSEASRQLGLRRPVKPLESAHVPTAIALGMWRPVVLLPQGQLDELSPQDLMKIALHECAHVRRRDTLFLRAMLVMRTLCFFQPLAWLAVNRATLLAEHACDEAVLRATGEPLPYAKLLTHLAETSMRPSLSMRMATGILLNKSAFVERVEAVLDEGRARGNSLSRLARGLIGVAAFACLTVAIAAPLNGTGMADGFIAEGRVVDDQGRPVSDADVYACVPNGVSTGFFLSAQSKSDVQGAFRFDNLPRRKDDGTWVCILHAWKKGHAWGSRYENDWDGRPERAAGVTGVEIRLIAPATFEGRVINRANKPIVNARITGGFERDRKPLYWVWSGGESFGSQHTDNEGRFRFQDVPAGCQARLEVVAEGYGMIGINSYVRNMRPGEAPLANRTAYFQLDGREALVQLGPESRILGTLVESATGKPVSGVQICASEKTYLADVFTRTDADGRFALKNLVAGTYTVRAIMSDRRSLLVRAATVALGEGEEHEGLQLKREEGVRLKGRVLDKTNGKPLEGIIVGCILSPEQPIQAASTITDAQGEYYMVVMPGSYEIGAYAGQQPGKHAKVRIIVTEGREDVRVDDILLDGKVDGKGV